MNVSFDAGADQERQRCLKLVERAMEVQEKRIEALKQRRNEIECRNPNSRRIADCDNLIARHGHTRDELRGLVAAIKNGRTI